mgnify:CR=1 FL=1
MPRLHWEALLFCLAWAALAIGAGWWGGWWLGVGLSFGLLILVSAASLQVLARTEDAALERQVRWGILAVAGLGVAVWLNAF